MKKILINYADSVYEPARKWNTWTGYHVAHFDKVIEYGPNDIDKSFRQKYKDILSIKRGNGLWLWKPYLINKTISNAKNGDIIAYVDSGAFFIRGIREILNQITNDNPIFVTDIPLIEINWSKPYLFEYMDAWEYAFTNQIQGTFIFFMVNEYSRSFFREFLRLCCIENLILPEGLGKFERVDRNFSTNFVSHREDQSILSLLCKKNGIKAHLDISQRSRGGDFRTIINIIVLCLLIILTTTIRRWFFCIKVQI